MKFCNGFKGASPIVQRCEPWDFNNIETNKSNYNGTNESKSACCSKIATIQLKVANFEEKVGIETKGVKHEENHISRGN